MYAYLIFSGEASVMKKRRCCDETRTLLVSNHRMSKLKTHTIAWNISRNNLYSCGLCTRMLTVYWVMYSYVNSILGYVGIQYIYWVMYSYVNSILGYVRIQYIYWVAYTWSLFGRGLQIVSKDSTLFVQQFYSSTIFYSVP